jgi:hypothetical protein
MAFISRVKMTNIAFGLLMMNNINVRTLRTRHTHKSHGFDGELCMIT